MVPSAIISRSGLLALSFSLVAFGSALTSRAQEPSSSTGEVGFEVTPAPGWVKPVKAPNEIETGVENSGVVLLLIDRQENLEQNAFYYHEVRRLTSENGVQNGAAISVSFDPAFERLSFNSVQLVRDGVATDRLDRSRIRLSQSAKDPDRLIYDSSFSADLVLEDVRVGDVIEFSYTKVGANPLKQGKYTATYSMQWDFPVGRNALRLICAATRKLRFEARNGAPQPMVTTRNGMTELLCEARNVPKRVVPDEVPEDYSPRQRLGCVGTLKPSRRRQTARRHGLYRSCWRALKTRPEIEDEDKDDYENGSSD